MAERAFPYVSAALLLVCAGVLWESIRVQDAAGWDRSHYAVSAATRRSLHRSGTWTGGNGAARFRLLEGEDLPAREVGSWSTEEYRRETANALPTLILVGGALGSIALFLLLRELRSQRPPNAHLLLRQELRQPLTSALVWLDLLQRQGADDALVRRAQMEIRRASEIISQATRAPDEEGRGLQFRKTSE